MAIFIKSECYILNCSSFYPVLPALKLTYKAPCRQEYNKTAGQSFSPTLVEAIAEVSTGFRDSSPLL